MGVIMIRCPHTGLAVSTGIETDDETFDALPDSLGLAVCPKCGLNIRGGSERLGSSPISPISRLRPNNRSLSCRPRWKTRTTGIGELRKPAT